jgi:hypothetical protein
MQGLHALFGWLISQPANSIFPHVKSSPAISQPAVFFSHNKPAPAIG